jgi:hypothetical protein
MIAPVKGDPTKACNQDDATGFISVPSFTLTSLAFST